MTSAIGAQLVFGISSLLQEYISASRHGNVSKPPQVQANCGRCQRVLVIGAGGKLSAKEDLLWSGCADMRAFLCVDVILVPLCAGGIFCYLIRCHHISVIPSGVIPSGVISVGSYECTERYGAPEPYCIKINIPAFTLTLLSGKALVKTYPIAVGKPASPSRIGTCKVVEKAMYPTWYPPDGRPPVPPGPTTLSPAGGWV